MLLRWPLLKNFYQEGDEKNNLLVYSHPMKEKHDFNERCYFKLYHDLNYLAPVKSRERDFFHQVQESEYQAVADFINRCYENTHLSVEQIHAWTKESVHDPKLWVWLESNCEK
ncbi:MAG: hypothetical protein JXR88_04635 [Clostridia bacterium]|nr:hypothetical protein [Clostridia bacterium]